MLVLYLYVTSCGRSSPAGNVFVPECMCELQDFSSIDCEGGEEADDEDNSRPYQDMKVSIPL